MTWPGLPTSLSGAYVIESTIDEECQANLVTHLGRPFGCWLDDSTPNLNKWRALAVAKYGPLGHKVFVCVPPGHPNVRYGPAATVISVYEAYIYGMGCPPAEWLPLPKFDAYCVQRSWPGTHGKTAPTEPEGERLLNLVQAHHPKYIFLF